MKGPQRPEKDETNKIGDTETERIHDIPQMKEFISLYIITVVLAKSNTMDKVNTNIKLV